MVCDAWAQSSQPPPPTPLVSGQEKEEEPAIGNQDATPYQRGTKDAPVFIKKIQSEYENKQAANEAREKEDSATNERVLRWANVVIAGFTIVLAFISGLMWWTGRDAARRQLRAYVHVELVEAYCAPGGNTVIRVILRNSGQTPAYDMTAWVGTAVEDYGLKKPLADPHPSMTLSRGILPSNSVTPFSLTVIHGQIDEGTISDIEMRQKALYAYGEIRYTDAFKRPRITKYRFFLIGKLRREDGEPVPMSPYEDDEGNKAT